MNLKSYKAFDKEMNQYAPDVEVRLMTSEFDMIILAVSYLEARFGRNVVLHTTTEYLNKLTEKEKKEGIKSGWLAGIFVIVNDEQEHEVVLNY